VLIYELALLHNELLTCIADLPSWTCPRSHDRSLLVALCSPSTQYDALGVVLLIGAWNYPLLLALQPLISALAAGEYGGQ
jgi:aldehyde dehydrogenase (NAD+)